MTKTSTRWSHLVRHGLVGTSLLGAAAGTAEARPCDDIASRTVGFVLGVDLAPRARLFGGVEARVCLDDRSEAMARVEVGGGMRLIVGARARPFESNETEHDRELLGLEAGLMLDAHQRFGVHAAATYGTHSAYLALQGLVAASDGAAPRYSLLGGLAPWTALDDAFVVEGRPLRHGGGYVCPRVAANGRACATAEERDVRDHFTGSAQLELSSVWTFLRLAQELAAVGAPAALVAAALDAADDEVRHAELCAAAAGGVALLPLPMAAARPRFTARSTHALAVLAGEAWREGCLNETAAAEEARLAAGEAQGAAPEMLRAIAADEDRHAELSWAVLAWVRSVAPAITAAVMILPRGDEGAGDHARFDRALARHGVPSPAITAAARAHARTSAALRARPLG